MECGKQRIPLISLVKKKKKNWNYIFNQIQAKTFCKFFFFVIENLFNISKFRITKNLFYILSILFNLYSFFFPRFQFLTKLTTAASIVIRGSRSSRVIIRRFVCSSSIETPVTSKFYHAVDRVSSAIAMLILSLVLAVSTRCSTYY